MTLDIATRAWRPRRLRATVRAMSTRGARTAPIPALPKVFRRIFDPVPEVPDAPDADVVAFWEHQRQQGLRNWRVFMLFCAVSTLLWWPTDLLFFRSVPRAIGHFAIARAVAAGLTLGAFFAVEYLPIAKRNGYGVIVTSGLIIAWVAGWQFGAIGPPSEPWFHFGHFLVLCPVAVSLRPRRRALYHVLLAAAYIGGYFGMHPAHFGDPLAGAAINFHLFAGIFGWVAGVAADQLRFRGFILHTTATRQADELRRLKDDLERRVEERTREVRHLSAHLETVRETERTHLARELHDELGQELTALRYAVELAVRRYGTDPQSIQPNLADLVMMVQRTRIATRELVAELRPRVLDELGLVAAAEALIKRTRERAAIDVELVAPTDVALTPDVATAGYRILQECLTNALRHAAPTRIHVALAREPDALVISVRDDGVGFDRTRVTSGFGLLGMRERAAANGILLELDSAPGRGTSIRARLPIVKDLSDTMGHAA